VSGFAKAALTAKTDQSGREIPVAAREWLPVDFNPETLKLSITNAMGANTKRRKKEPPQFVTDSTAKLSVELVFDSTTYGNDVREMTSLVAQMMKPKGTAQQQQKKKGIPAIVVFEWGTFLFEGYIESFNETLDFFAAEGVPLRSTVSLSITEQDDPFRAPSGDGFSDVGLLDDVLPTAAPPVPLGGDRSVDDLALESGDPAAAGRIAAANGVENRRFPEVASIALPESGGRAPAVFASSAGGAGIGAAAGGAGIGATGGAVSFGAGAGASLNAGLAGGAGIGISAGADAFAGLSSQVPVAARPRIELSAEALGLGFGAGLGASAGAGAGVRLGGSARASASASLSADVGTSASARIIFEES
jgi:Contractile injection system tube protein